MGTFTRFGCLWKWIWIRAHLVSSLLGNILTNLFCCNFFACFFKSGVVLHLYLHYQTFLWFWDVDDHDQKAPRSSLEVFWIPDRFRKCLKMQTTASFKSRYDTTYLTDNELDVNLYLLWKMGGKKTFAFATVWVSQWDRWTERCRRELRMWGWINSTVKLKQRWDMTLNRV